MDHGPVSGPDGNRTHHTDFARISRLPWNMPARLSEVRPGIEPGTDAKRWSPLLTTEVCCRNTYRPSSDPGWNRTIVFLAVDQASSPLDHGIMSVTEAGVEPAKSRGSRPRRFACLRTRPWRVRVLLPAVQANEARLGTGPPAVKLQAPVSNRAHRPYGSQLGTCQACNRVTKGRVELPCPPAGTTF